MPAPATDVLIAGGGPVGCALALALRESALSVVLLERDSPARIPYTPAFRPLALSYASRLILERVGAWGALPATPIATVHASQQGGFGRTRMHAAECGVPALGYVVDYSVLHAALRSRLSDAGIRVVHEETPARCVVHAEGLSAEATEKRYGQAALVCVVHTAIAAGNTAFERFTSDGPLALLPFDGRYAVVWSTRPERAQALAGATEQAFLSELAQTAGSHVGRVLSVESRSVQPLALRVRAARVGNREAYVGNAAQTLHPVAGQGLNLGLRDAWDLAQILRDSDDPGDPRTLARYAASRRADALATIRITDALAGAFMGNNRVARAARGLALVALDVLPAPRRFFARRMIYGPSALP